MQLSETGLMIVRHFFVIGLLWALPAFCENANFWIIESPSALLIYNQYEQRLDPGEKSGFSAFSAWQIMAPARFLSDQYTKVLPVKYEQQYYFLQITDQNELVNRAQAGQIEQIKNVTLLDDTIRIKNSDQIKLDTGYSRQTLSEGILLQRMFQYGHRIFVREISGQRSGWLSGGKSSDYEIYQIDQRAIAYQNNLYNQVDHIVESYNQRLDKLFSHLNQWYKKTQIPPKWERSVSDAQLTYRLTPDVYQNDFPVTRAYLVQELNDLLHGSDYILMAGQTNLTIKKLAP